MIGERQLREMKAGAVLINTARGDTVDETSLIRALEEGRIGGAGLDCLSVEPPPPDPPLLSFSGRLVITPHIAGTTREAMDRVGTDAVTLLDYLDGNPLDRSVVVNSSALDRSNLKR